MPRPTSSLLGGAAKIEVPSGWFTSISPVSRQSYAQVCRVRYELQGASNTHYFASPFGRLDQIMADSITGSTTFTISPQFAAFNIDLTFYYSKDSSASGKKVEQHFAQSSQLFLVPISRPSSSPSAIRDYVTYLIFVEDAPSSTTRLQTSERSRDAVATVHVVEDEIPLTAGNALFQSSFKAIGDFQFSLGIPDKELVHRSSYTPPPPYSSLPVCIIGAGASGLYAATILDSLDIKYEILEASGRHGGRLYTHQFNKLDGPYQYFDAGAMRYPEIDMMKRTFDLIRNRLKIGDKLRPVIMSNPNTFLLFNGHRTTKDQYNAAANDTFKVGATADNKDGYIREPYLSKGHKALYEEAIEPLLQLFFNESFPAAFEMLMEYDRYSVRDYMTTHLGYPNSVVRWIETMEWRTGWFDLSLTEIVLASLAFNDPRDKSEGKEAAWYCFDGGSRVLSDALLAAVSTKPEYYKRVTAIKEIKGEEYYISVTVDGRDDPRLTKNYTVERKYSNVISTLPLSVLRTLDLDNIELSVGQRNALRELLYSPSINVGIQFKTAWWEKLGIVGGQSHTDRPVRSIIYPSYGPGIGGEKSNILIASCNGSQDPQRLCALMKGSSSAEEKMLLNLIMNDLAVVHGVSIDEIWDQYVDHYAWDWHSSSLSLGAFARFGPGQFKDIYPHITMPASTHQRLFFAGDATSAAHGWVTGSLNSAWRCVRSMLVAHPELNPSPDEDILKKFTDEWGSSEEWDDRVLEKHVYIGRILTEKRQAQPSFQRVIEREV